MQQIKDGTFSATLKGIGTGSAATAAAGAAGGAVGGAALASIDQRTPHLTGCDAGIMLTMTAAVQARRLPPPPPHPSIITLTKFIRSNSCLHAYYHTYQ